MKYTLEIEIDKPRDEVVLLFDNEENLACWQPGFIKSTHVSGEPGQPGSKSAIDYQHENGRRFTMEETVTARNLPDEFSAIYHTPGIITMDITNRFREGAPGKTLWISENRATFHGLMMKVIGFLMPGCCRKESWKFMENFKAFAETGADVRNQSTGKS